MNFLVDTNIASDFIRGRGTLASRFVQYGGRLHFSTISLSELYTWAYKRESPEKLLQVIGEFKSIMTIVPFTDQIAETLGRIRGEQMRRGILFSPIDLQIAATAITFDLTLITHNIKDFQSIPGLQFDNWI